ncbi:O-antigen ligase [Bacterioplanoides sp. SCSIO 12839]|uniref:O-antigen ligase family protein n=1 Tax=Bacterioplanoides sp. SCSIO 12839 TaxID=2829569 RepID=UPI0021042544|nr:O-antigen ligase family protein [Bacterioplanoides sp. SCSIO 12839]UTW48988.1 O-antigen ligase family protein [Bacterioplanoides sp. SCSIO 12839]
MSNWKYYLLVLFTLPLPFSGNVDWAWPLFCAAVFFMLFYELKTSVYPLVLTKASPVWLLLLVAQLWVIIQSLLLDNRHDIQHSLLQGLGLVAFFVLTLLLLTTRERIKRAIWVVILAASFQAIYGALMVLSGLEWSFFTEKSSYRGTATGTFINRNHLAGYLEMSLALGIGFLLSQSARYRGSWRQRLRQTIDTILSPKVIMRLLLAVMVIALVLTRSRMGNTAFFASLMITGALALLLMKNRSRATTVLLTSLLVIDVAIVGTFFGVEKVAERLQNTSVEKESRDEVARDTYQMWQQNPALGIGAGSYQYTYPAYRSADVTVRGLYDHAHNDYLQFLAEFGLPGFIALMLAAVWCGWLGLVAMRKRHSNLMKGLGFASTMGLLAIAIHSSVDFNLQIPANAFMFVFLMAMACIARYTPLR